MVWESLLELWVSRSIWKVNFIHPTIKNGRAFMVMIQRLMKDIKGEYKLGTAT